jgi:hypothetical protein
MEELSDREHASCLRSSKSVNSYVSKPGGYIRNAALRAAFLAADAGTPISDAELEHAAQLEYEGMGKIVTPNPAKASAWPSRLSSSL